MSSFSEKAQREFLREVEWSTLRLAVTLQFNHACVLEAAALLARVTRDPLAPAIASVEALVDAIEAALKTAVLRGTQPLLRWLCVHLARISLAQSRVPKYRYVPPLHATVKEPPPPPPSLAHAPLPLPRTPLLPPLQPQPYAALSADYSAVPFRYDAENRARPYQRPLTHSATSALYTPTYTPLDVDAHEPPTKRRRLDSDAPSHRAAPPPGIDLSDAADPYLTPVGEIVHIFETSIVSHVKCELFVATRAQLRAPSRLILRLYRVTTSSDISRARVTRSAALEWPPETQLSLNRTRVPVPTRASGIIDVTAQCEPGLNQLDLTLKELKGVYVGVLQAMTATTPDALLAALPRLERDWTLSLVRASFAGGDAEELVEVARQVSLVDAVGRTRFTHPVRALSCAHVQVFDARVWLLVNEKTRQWTCPLCARPVRWQDVRRDAYFDDMLARVPAAVTEVTLREDGSWTAPDTERAQLLMRGGALDHGGANSVVVLLDSDDERDDKPAPTPRAHALLATVASTATAPAAATDSGAVIDLTDSPLRPLSHLDESDQENEDASSAGDEKPPLEERKGSDQASAHEAAPTLADVPSPPPPSSPALHCAAGTQEDVPTSALPSPPAGTILDEVDTTSPTETTFHVTFDGLTSLASPSSPLRGRSRSPGPSHLHHDAVNPAPVSTSPKERRASRSPSRYSSRSRSRRRSRSRSREREKVRARERARDHRSSHSHRHDSSRHDSHRAYDDDDNYHRRDERYAARYRERDRPRHSSSSSSRHSYEHRRHY